MSAKLQQRADNAKYFALYFVVQQDKLNFAVMKKLVFLLFSVALLCGVTSCGRHEKRSLPDGFTTVCLIRTTPVKDQGRTALGWVYAMMGTMESEHIMQGDSVNLSPYFFIRSLLSEQLRWHYLTASGDTLNLSGTPGMYIRLARKYGAMPYDSYFARQAVNMQVLCRKLLQTASVSTSLHMLDAQSGSVFDGNLGYLPLSVYMLGAEYTPVEFAHSMCAPDEYIGATSFTHHPFNQFYRLETAGNTLGCSVMNVPIAQLMHHIKAALKHGHPVCWEGDTTEVGYHGAEGVARCTQGNVSQSGRQIKFERHLTTADHCMELIGMARDARGRYYAIARNSMGTGYGFNGCVYMELNYLALNTIDAYMTRDAWMLGE